MRTKRIVPLTILLSSLLTILILTQQSGDHKIYASTPDVSQNIGQLAFEAGQDIYLVDADGSNLHRLTDTNNNTLGTWSPDGKQILFTSSRSGLPEVYKIDEDGQNLIRLTKSPANTAAVAQSWSPDGKRVVYIVETTDNGKLSTDLYLMDADGQKPTKLNNQSGFYIAASWSPKDGYIAILASNEESKNDEISIVDLAAKNIILMANDHPSSLGYGPLLTWSPDGSKIMYIHSRDPYSAEGVYDIYLIDVKSRQVRNLTASWKTAFASPSWSPDGKNILALSIENKTATMVKIGLDDPNQMTTLVDQIGDCKYIALSPDGKYIAFVTGTGNSGGNIYVMDANGKNWQQITLDNQVTLNLGRATVQWRPSSKS